MIVQTLLRCYKKSSTTDAILLWTLSQILIYDILKKFDQVAHYKNHDYSINVVFKCMSAMIWSSRCNVISWINNNIYLYWIQLQSFCIYETWQIIRKFTHWYNEDACQTSAISQSEGIVSWMSEQHSLCFNYIITIYEQLQVWMIRSLQQLQALKFKSFTWK